MVLLYVNTIVSGAIALIVIVAASGIYYHLRGMRKMMIALIVFLLCLPFYFGVRETGNTISGEQQPEAYRGGAEWVRTNVAAGRNDFQHRLG
ncbi:MAG: hypothetical protein WKF84_25035 [Pyrinomonadaceae bacterium]